jgi:hypothetical protein
MQLNLPNVLSDISKKKGRLPDKIFQDANQHKIMWVKAATIECKLRLNEPVVLEALAFLTDPRMGIGKPSIATIMERILDKKGTYLSYNAVQGILKRLEFKGAIGSIAGKYKNGWRETNTFKLIGFEYKLANNSPDSGTGINLLDPVLTTIPSNEIYRDSESRNKGGNFDFMMEERIKALPESIKIQAREEMLAALQKQSITYKVSYLNKIIARLLKNPQTTGEPMATNKASFFENALEAQTSREKAVALATERMKAEGCFYPIHTTQAAGDYLDELNAYGAKHSKYVVEFMRQPSGSRPLELDNVKLLKPVNQWGRPYYDD